MPDLSGLRSKLPSLSGRSGAGPKTPDFLADVYYDLRDRRLLPLVVLVVVAIVATPLLLGQKSEPLVSPGAEGAISALQETGAPTSALTVVEATPGLREYKKRLKGRTPTDPFRSLGGGSESHGGGASTASGSTSSATSASTTTSTSTTTETSSSNSPAHSQASPSPVPPSSTEGSGGGGESVHSGGAKPGGGSGGGGGKSHAVLYTFVVDLQIVHTTGSETKGDKKTSEPEARKEVLPTTVLPGEKKQVVTYMGLSPKTRKPLFLVSTDVTGVFGEGKCVAGTDKCQLIELEPGFPETFEYGEDGERYKLKVTDVEFVVTGHV
ncbi:MAG TPA: hypothetical protein VFN89_03425 [Solirubrobacterales bacterium]|nr:hypothetical protein [Solirubrobacterales bacterium]